MFRNNFASDKRKALTSEYECSIGSSTAILSVYEANKNMFIVIETVDQNLKRLII